MVKADRAKRGNMRDIRRDETAWESFILDRVFADVRDARRNLSGRAVMELIESRIGSMFETYDPIDPEYHEMYLELCQVRSSHMPRKVVRDRLRELVRRIT